MSSIYKDDRSPFFTACFIAIIGNEARQIKKTTATADRELAKLIAVKLEEAGRGAIALEKIKAFLGDISDLRARRAAQRAFDDVLRATTGRAMESRTARSFVEGWLARTKGEVASGTWHRYNATSARFLRSLGGKADEDIGAVTQEDIARFRDDEAARVKPATANVSLKIIRILFKCAEASRAVTRNEARHVAMLKRRDKATERRAFTLDELKRVLEACDDEWRSLVLFGFYTGGRLGDLAALTWQNIDLARGELRYESQKTGRTVILPLAKPLRAHIEGLPAGDDPSQPLHPRSFKVTTEQGRVGTLSNAFHRILVSAGLAKHRTHEKDMRKKGRSGHRKRSEVSFHALRHTAVTLLKMAGVGEAVAMDLVGHESAEISRHYTHVDHDTKLDAVNRLPVLTTARTATPAGGQTAAR